MLVWRGKKEKRRRRGRGREGFGEVDTPSPNLKLVFFLGREERRVLLLPPKLVTSLGFGFALSFPFLSPVSHFSHFFFFFCFSFSFFSVFSLIFFGF